MDLRKALLKTELDRIQAEAEAKSYAIMNRAADLETAHKLCVLLNTEIAGETPLRPCVVYEGNSLACRVKIVAGESGSDVLHVADRNGIGWSSERSSGNGHDIRFDGFDSIEVVIGNDQFHIYLESVEATA